VWLAAAEAHNSAPFLVVEIISVIVAVGGVTFGGIASWVAARRKTSGKIGTSSAETLWAQAQNMREMLLAEKSKVEEQRDRLIEAHSSQILPLLAAIDETLRQLGASIALVIGHEEKESAASQRVEDALSRAGRSLAEILHRLEARNGTVQAQEQPAAAPD
jgi:hypothetical protein